MRDYKKEYLTAYLYTRDKLIEVMKEKKPFNIVRKRLYNYLYVTTGLRARVRELRKIDFDAKNEMLKVNNLQIKLPHETFVFIKAYFDFYFNEYKRNKIYYYDSKIFANADKSTFQIDFEKEIELNHLRIFEDFVMLLIEDTFNPPLIMKYTGLDSNNLELIASKLGYILSDDKKNFVNIENRPVEIKRNELIHPLKSLEDEDGIIHYYLRKVA